MKSNYEIVHWNYTILRNARSISVVDLKWWHREIMHGSTADDAVWVCRDIMTRIHRSVCVCVYLYLFIFVGPDVCLVNFSYSHSLIHSFVLWLPLFICWYGFCICVRRFTESNGFCYAFLCVIHNHLIRTTWVARGGKIWEIVVTCIVMRFGEFDRRNCETIERGCIADEEWEEWIVCIASIEWSVIVQVIWNGRRSIVFRYSIADASKHERIDNLSFVMHSMLSIFFYR